MAQAKSKGRGWHGDSAGHARAGRLGGEKVAQERGQSFYSAIGKKGGKESPGNFKNDPQRARRAGRKGGSASRR